MKKTLIFIMISLFLAFNSSQAEPKWVKDKKGCKIWWGYSAKDKEFKEVEWSGKCEVGYASGYGTIEYIDKKLNKGVITGNLKKGKIHGYAKYIWSNGETYSGMWKDSKIDGQGTYIWPNGDRYTGFWRNHIIHGKGTTTWGNYNNKCSSCYKKYVGTSVNGNFATGVMTLVNGERINTKWVPDQKECLVWNPVPQPNEKVTWTGQCNNGYADGKGTLKYISEKIVQSYVGQMKEGKKHGQGTYRWLKNEKPCTDCNKLFVGNFQNGEFGAGTFTLYNGKQIKNNPTKYSDLDVDRELYRTQLMLDTWYPSW